MIGDENTQIDGDRSRYVKGNQQQNIDGNDDTRIKKNRTSQIDKNEEHKTKGNFIIEVQGNTNISVDGDVDVWSGSIINCDAPVINLNCGIASQTSAQTPKEKVEVKDLGPEETGEYQSGVGDGCDGATDHYNNQKRDNSTME